MNVLTWIYSYTRLILKPNRQVFIDFQSLILYYEIFYYENDFLIYFSSWINLLILIMHRDFACLFIIFIKCYLSWERITRGICETAGEISQCLLLGWLEKWGKRECFWETKTFLSESAIMAESSLPFRVWTAI